MKFLTQFAAVLATVSLSTSSVLKAATKDEGTFELLILHNNDMHARFEQTSQLSGACTAADREAGKCYGGFPRVATVVKEARQAAEEGRGPPVLYLNAGDTYTGTAWFTIYKWKIAAEFVNALKPDAVSLGNNELKHGSTELSPFLDSITTTILACNVILKSNKENWKLYKSKTFNINGIKVGIIGYLTPESKILDSFGNIEYIDEVIALKEEVTKLQADNTNIIIALGHSDPNINIDIAKEVDGLDLVIGGHKNRFFWNGTNSESNLPSMEETVVVTQQSGRRVPVVQSYAYNQYLGQIVIKFDANGELVEHLSKPILLDMTIIQDQESLNTLKKYNDVITSLSEEIIGDTAVVLDGDSCKVEECNLGNLIVDAIVYHHAINFEGERWTDAAIAVIHGDAIAASIAPSNRPASINRNDLLTALPTDSTLVAVTMNGNILTEMIEHSVADYSITNPTGQFLQYSGIRVVYDLSKDPGSRIISASVRCWDCFVPEFYSIDDWRTYKVLMPVALANGEFGYSMLTDQTKNEVAYDEVTCVEEFIKLRSPVYPEVAGRVSLLNVDVNDDDSATALSSTTTILFVTLVLLVLS